MVHHSLSKFESIVIGGVSLPYQNLDIWKLRIWIWMIARGMAEILTYLLGQKSGRSYNR